MKYPGINAPWVPGDAQKHAELMVNLSSQLGEQAEIVAAEQDKQRENGTPANLTRMLDNQAKRGTTLDAVEESIIQTIVEQPHTAAYFKDNLGLWNAVAKEGKLTPTEQMNVARDVEKGANELQRRKEVELQGKRDRLAQTDLMAKQNAVMRDMIVRFGDWRDVDDATLRSRLRISGDAVGIQTDRWNLDDFRKRGVTEAVDLGNAVNVFWVRDIAKAIRTSVYGLTPEELAEVDENSPLYKVIAKQQMIQEENDALRGQTWWADTWNSVLSSVPLMIELAATGGESMSIRALATMGYKEAFKQFGTRGIAKMVGKGLAGAAVNGMKRLPFLVPGAAAKAYNENYLGGSVTIPDGNGGANITVKDAQVDDFFEGFISQLFQQYTEVTSEELGGLIPFGNADVTMLSRLVPAKVRKAFVQKLAWSPLTRNVVRRSIIDNIPFNGLLGEYAEEEIGNMMSFGATVLMTAFGADLENTPGTTAPLMSWGERGQTAASVALQTLLFRASTGAVRTWGQGGAARTILDAAKVKREIEQTDNLVEMVKQLPPFQTSVGEAKRLLQTVRRGDVTVSVAPDDASEMLSEAVKGKSKEEAKELLRTFADAGVTEESIAQAKKDGVNLALSHAGLVAIAANKNYKNGNEVKDAILGNAVTLVFGKKVKELAKDSFTTEQIKGMADRLTRIDKIVSDTRKVVSESFRTAQKNATDKGSKIGVSYRAFHDFLDVLSFKAAYLARHLKNEEGMAKLEQMVKGLSIQFAEDPEKFDANGALAQVMDSENRIRIPRPSYLEPLSPDVQAKIDSQRGEVRAKYEGTSEWMRAPNGKQSKLSEDLWITVRTQAFKDWFGEWENGEAPRSVPTSEGSFSDDTSDRKRTSRVAQGSNKDSTTSEKVKHGLLDENGEPLFVYHGTPQRFTRFRRVGNGRYDIGFHFGNFDQALDIISGDYLRVGDHDLVMNGGMYAGFLSIKNPLYIDTDFGSWGADKFARRLLEADAEGEPYFQLTERDRIDLVKAARKYTNRVELALGVLVRHGFDGVVYKNQVEGDRQSLSYIALDSSQFKEANNFGTFDAETGNIYYQNGETLQGAIDLTKFAESQQAIISLFKDANASTLPHESAHWLKEAMESLVAAGLADEEMAADLQSVNDWLDKQDYSAEAVGKFASNAVKDGVVDKAQARDEYFARAFEQYLQDGKFPEAATSGLKSALRSLTRALQAIYQKALIMGSPIDDSIRGFFDGLFTVDEVVDGTSTVVAILREVNAEAIALGKDDRAKLEKAVAGAEKDAESEAWLAAFQAYLKGLRSGRRQWRQEAKEAYAADKAEQAFAYVKAGHRLDEAFLRDILKLDEDTIAKLKAKRAVAKGAPVAAEPETAPAEAPAAPASAGPATELTGDAEQFKGLSDDAVVSLPADEAKAEDILSKLILGDIGKGGPMRKRLTIPKNVQVEDALYKGWQAAVKFFAKGKPVTKGELISYVSEAIKNLGKQGYRDDSAAPDSLNATIDDGEGGKTELGDLIGETDQAVGGGFSDVETYLDMMSDWTDTLKEGTTKREIADILYELADLGEIEPSNARIWEVYQERGFGAAEKTVYNAIPEVLKSRKDYFKSQGVRYQTAASNVPASIMETMKELGYDDALRLIGDLKLAVGQKQFIKEYMARRAEEYKNDFISNSPLWQTETGVADYLDAILKALKLTEGMKFSQRVRMEEEMAERELRERKVREVMGSLRSLEMSLRTSAARVLKAVKNNKEDKAAATTAALSMHRHAAQLGAARKLQAAIRRSMRSAERMGNAKQGKSIDGDYLNAILAVRNMFGMSQRKPKWTDGPNDPQTVGGVLRKYIRYIVETELGEVDTTSERHKKLFEEAYDFEMKRWPSWLWETIHGERSPVDFRDLTMKQFDEVMNFLDFLDGAGRDIRGEEKAAFGARVRDAVESIVKVTMGHNGKRTGKEFKDQKLVEKIRALAQSGMNNEKTLVSLCDMLDEYTEHYGEHRLGPWRRKFQMLLSAGESRRLHWQQKISKDIRPHLRALKKSAKKRGVTILVKNQPKNGSGYTEIKGQQAAFILLNAGCVENRERLMSGFGWSEDELNDILKQFTAEDFKHAEAVWAALAEMGEQVAGVFYRDRHYRMPRSVTVPIEFTNNYGETIVCEGGYYPIEYKKNTRKGENTAEAKMDETSIMTHPLPPSSTYERQAHVDGHLLLEPGVLTKYVHDNARYIGMWEPLRLANAIWTNQDVKDAVLLNYGPETYDAIRDLMQYANNPTNREKMNRFLRWSSVTLVTSALAFKLGTMLSQLQSFTVGVERLGRYFWHSAIEFTLSPIDMRRKVADLSPYMRDRYNQRERDLQDIGTEFDGLWTRTKDWYRRVGFFGLKLLDLHVAGIQWWAAYNSALANEANNLSPKEAAIFADDFVASTQGGARAVDMPKVQLDTLMRTLTPFFGPSVAAFNSRMAVLASLNKMEIGEAIEAVVMTFIVPAVLSGMKGGFLQGPSSGDDDDDWGRVQRGFIRGLMTDATSGIPIVQDVTDIMVGMAMTNGNNWKNHTFFEASPLRPLNDMANEAVDLVKNFEDNPEYSAYVGVSLTSEILGVPFVDAYENWEKFLLRHFGDSDSKTLKQTLKGGKTK